MNECFLPILPKPENPLKIAYVGNFTQPHCTDVHIRHSLEALGHTVVAIQEREVTPQTPTVDDILERSRGCDIWLYTRTWGMTPKGGHDGTWLLSQLKAVGIPTASLHLDLYVGLARETDIRPDNPFWATDFVFTADGGHQDFFKARGINHHHLSPGILHTEALLGTPREEMKADIVFVGSYKHYPREWPFRQRLIEWLKGTYGDRFQMWVDGRGVRNQDLNDLYASAKIAIGDSIYVPNYWSDRYFETTGRGGFLIAPMVPGLERFFPGDLLTTFDNEQGNLTDFSKLKALIDYYLENDAEREIKRRKCFDHVRHHHTYMHRLLDVLDIIATENSAENSIEKPTLCKKCLNLGSGNAEIVRRFPALAECDITAVDLMDFGNNVVHDLSIFPWPFENDAFDEILAIDILEHIPDCVGAINEMIRVCKPGGHIFVQSPNAAYPKSVWADPEHLRGFAKCSFDYWVRGLPLFQNYGRSHNRDMFFIDHLEVAELNKNLTFSFRKEREKRNVVTITHEGRSYTIEGWAENETVFRSIKLAETFYEIEELKVIRDMCIPGTYVDVGANIGNHSVFFIAECPSVELVSIEAIKPLADLAKKNLAKNAPPGKGWEVKNFAIVNSDKTSTEMWLAGDINMGRSQLPKSGKVASDVNLSGQTITTPCARLDYLLSDVANIGLIKLDIEGDEVAALKSGMVTIGKDKPIIVCECSIGWDQKPNAEAAEISRLLEPLGYSMVAGPIGYAQGPTYIWKVA